MKSTFILTALAAAVSFVSAQQEAPAYGQCGGKNYKGATTCVSGYHCSAYNDFYSQCVPGVESSSLSTVTPTTSSSSKAVVSTGTKTSSSARATSSTITSHTTTVATSTTSAVKSKSPTTTTPSNSKTVTAADASKPSTSGTQFVIDGKSGYFAGTNSYWIGFLTNDSDVDLVMQHLSESGLKILRVWGFNDVTSTPSSDTVYFQSFAGDEPTINTGANGLQRLDYVVKSAEAHGIKLIINFVNNWSDYGGMAAYFSYAGISSNAQWYNSTAAQTQYRKYIRAVVSRYLDSTAILAWELANEPRCTSCDPSVLHTWIRTTAAYIKALDPAHMLAIGDEGFGLDIGNDGSYPYTTGAGGSNFSANCEIPDIDFCTFHLYPESWSVSPTKEWGDAWIVNHADACVALGKPCLLEEYGASDNCTVEAEWQATALSANGIAADLFWQYGDTLSSGKTSQDGNTVFYGEELFTCLVTDHVAAIDAL